MSTFDDSKNTQGHCSHSNFSRQMRRSITKVKESIQKIADYKITNDEPLHIVPKHLAVLTTQTGFTRNEIRRLYQNFKQHCPTGAVTWNEFKPIYAKIFPLGDSRKYAQLVFNHFDEDRDGIVSFSDLLIILAFIIKGDIDDKLSWIFRLYDLDGNGYITKQEMTVIISAIYEMIHKYCINDCINHVERFFGKMDLNKDGVISREEFMIKCKKDDKIINQLNLFNCVF